MATAGAADSQVSGLFDEENTRAEECLSNGDLKGAAQVLVPIVEKDPENWRAYNNIGIISWTQKAWADAFAMFKRSALINPGSVDTMINLFDAALKLRRVGEVLPVFEQAHAANPASEEIQIILQALKDQGDAIYGSERALIVGRYNPRIEEAEKYLENGQLFRAMETYLKVNDQEGPCAEAFGGLGVVSYYQERYEDAFALFVESIKLNPVNPDMYMNLIDAAKECGRIPEAKAVYETFLAAFPIIKGLAPEFEALGA